MAQIFVRAQIWGHKNLGGGSLYAPFSLFVKSTPVGRIRAPSCTGGGPRHPARLPDGDSRSGGRLVKGCCQGANAVASASSLAGNVAVLDVVRSWF